uniref:Theg spermatid protein like n=1 Tax=Molossus molossus TaxID=27622 RepID=A0A7J8K1T2_MOLMO|nr:theg spermatid protein like [Molossus molossus]
MKNQEFSGSSELSDGCDATETPTGSEALQTPEVHEDEPAEPDEPEKPEEAHQQGQRDQLNEFSEPYELYEPYEPSEFQAPRALRAPQEPEDLYELCEFYEPCEPRKPQKCHEPYESYEPYEYYQPYEPHAPCEPQDPSAPRESQEPFAPRKPQEHHASRKPRKPSTSRKSQGPQAPREPYKAHEAELLPRTTMMMAPSLVTKFQPRIPLSTLSAPVPRELARKCFFSRKRMKALSKPKKQWRAPDRKLLWGNQDPIRPICRTALKNQLTRRLENLAQPKEVSHRYVPNRAQYYYSCGRESLIWDIPTPVLLIKPSKRIRKLAQPNKFKNVYLINRSFSDSLTESLEMSGPSPRIIRLSIAKELDPDYVPPKSIETKIPVSSLNAVATQRIIDLAHPKIKIEGLCYPRERCDMPIRPISQAALLAKPSPRIIALAKPKPLHEDYLPNRDPSWPVSYAALHSKVTPRIKELANPSARTPVHFVYYDPEVFKVKPAALKAQCPPRILQLAEPITH